MRGFACALLVVCLLTGPTAPATPASSVQSHAIGTIVQAQGAQLGSGAASRGATVFDGDVLGTDTDGALRLRAGVALVYLGGRSGAKLRRAAGGLQTELLAGTVVLSSAQVSAMEILVTGAQIRPSADGPTVAQVTLAGPKELHILARRGALQFSYGGESEMIPEGASYRVVLDPSEEMAAAELMSAQGPQGAGTRQYDPPKKPKRRRRAFIFLLWGSAAAVTAIVIHEALESPDGP